MDVQEFERILHLGLGRAILHLQNHDSTPYRDVILHACLHTISYDTQLEGTKSAYMMDIIERTDEIEFYRRYILDAAIAVDAETEDWDEVHLFDMVQHFAERGDIEARKIIFDRFLATYATDSIWCSERIIELDGLDGFLYVAEKLGEIALNQPDYTDDDLLLIVIEEKLGEEKSKEALHQARQRNPRVDAYLKIMEQARQQRKKKKRSNPRKLTYNQIKVRIDEKKRIHLQLWGKFASDEDLNMAAADLLQEQIPEKLLQYLKIFFYRPFPLDFKLLFKLVESEHENVPIFALNVLKNTSHPAMREFALQFIQEGKWIGRAIELLNNNFEEGDWALLEGLTRLKLEPEDHHHLQMNIKAIFRQHPAKEAAGALMNLYEYAPCSFCREEVLEQLHSIDRLPDTIREEALYDSNLDIRKLAKNNFQSKA